MAEYFRKEGSSAPQFRHFPSVPYPPPPGAPRTSLHNLDVWLPSTEPIPEEDVQQIWIIYLHGGAWRDPSITSSSFAACVPRLLDLASPDCVQIAGLASVDYRLARYNHSDSRSAMDAEGPGVERERMAAQNDDDPAYTAVHPDPIHDVQAAIAHLQRTYHFGSSYFLVGHSCGATIAWQILLDIGIASANLPPIQKPVAVITLAGIFSIPDLLRHHPVDTQPIYTELVTSAFGPDEGLWSRVSPTEVLAQQQRKIRDSAAQRAEAEPVENALEKLWPEGRLFVLAHSENDELVEQEQADRFESVVRECLGPEPHGCLERGITAIKFWILGTHDECWETGGELAGTLNGGLEFFEKIVLTDRGDPVDWYSPPYDRSPE
ncbi:MAG: hypothetical protein M1817_001641 [Caeruleum heppii]|nr:MAG: hypothetical protein M1817_001641 [Caeruleum heppii]